MSKKMIRPAVTETDQVVSRTSANSTPTQTCSQCDRQKPLTAFAVDRHRPNGRRNVCAECRAAYDSTANYRRRSQKYGHEPVIVPFTRSQVAERYGDHCYYCPLRRKTGAFEGLDHVVCVAAGGHHTLGNIRPCCRSCNSWKRWAVDELLMRDLRVDLDEVELLFKRIPAADRRGR
jgi:HNH endonuclease